MAIGLTIGIVLLIEGIIKLFQDEVGYTCLDKLEYTHYLFVGTTIVINTLIHYLMVGGTK